MNATQSRPRRTLNARPVPARPIPDLLRELAYHLHTTRVVAQVPATTSR